MVGSGRWRVEDGGWKMGRREDSDEEKIERMGGGGVLQKMAIRGCSLSYLTHLFLFCNNHKYSS